MLKLKSRCIEGLSMIVYACPEGVDKQSALIMFNDIMTVFNLSDQDKDIVMPFAEKALVEQADKYNMALITTGATNILY